MGGECEVKRGLHQLTATMDDDQCGDTLRPLDDRYGPVFFFYVIYLNLLFPAKSFVELVCYIFSLPEVKQEKLSFLSGHISQDPLENFFGCQRQCGGTTDNPSVKEFYQNTQSLRVVDSFCRAPVRGIVVEVQLLKRPQRILVCH